MPLGACIPSARSKPFRVRSRQAASCPLWIVARKRRAASCPLWMVVHKRRAASCRSGSSFEALCNAIRPSRRDSERGEAQTFRPETPLHRGRYACCATCSATTRQSPGTNRRCSDYQRNGRALGSASVQCSIAPKMSPGRSVMIEATPRRTSSRASSGSFTVHTPTRRPRCRYRTTASGWACVRSI